MTKEDIDRIATEYLNDTENELEMQDVIELADKALILEKAIEDIKAEIREYRNNFILAGRHDLAAVAETCLMFIHKHISGKETE